MNQVVVGTVMGGAQPVAAALDYEGWADVVGTVAGDDTVLVICPDAAPGRRSGIPFEDDAGVMTDTVQTAVVGVTGYAGAELARLLLRHPRLKGKPPVFAGAWTRRMRRGAEFLWARFIRNWPIAAATAR